MKEVICLCTSECAINNNDEPSGCHNDELERSIWGEIETNSTVVTEASDERD